MSETSPKVSVLLITYNHARFVAEAIESILMQRVEFDFEVVVADDGSTDRTLKIIKESAARDSRLRLLPSESNVGISRNYQRGFAACRGDYVAIIEGDDYWISPRKLQLTANFLDRNPSCSFCFHRVIRYNSLPESARLFPPHWSVEQHLTGRELAENNFTAGVSTCVYRRQVVAAVKPELWDLDIREWPFNVVMAESGSIGYVPQLLSIYRAHKSGIFSLLSNQEQFTELCRLIEPYDKVLDYKFTGQFQKMKAASARALAAGPRRGLNLRTRMWTNYWRTRIWIAQRLPRRLKDNLK